MKSARYPTLIPWHGSCDSINAGGRGAVRSVFTSASGRSHLMLTQLTHDTATPHSRRRWLAATAGLVLGLAAISTAKAADDTIKGGVLGKKLEAVVVDPASNWPLFAEKARELITKDKVAVVFGCWTSVSRKSVLPVFKELNSILFYPVQYEGEESERNVFYTGAAPNQQAIPAVDYLMSKDGGEAKRWVLAGTDYVYPRTTNKILEAYLKQKGVADADIIINYTPIGRPSCRTSRSSARPARRPRSCPPSTATPTCRSTRSSATRASRRPTSLWSRSPWARKSSPASTP